MRSGEREQNSRCRTVRTQHTSARSRPLAVGLELTARGCGGSSGMMIGSSGWQHSAGAWTGRAGERLEQALEQADGDLRWWGRGYDRQRRGVGSAHHVEELASRCLTRRSAIERRPAVEK